MKKWIVPIVIVALFLIYAVSARNGLVNKDELVNESWSNVETNYQRRMDLIGNLVNTVKGYANFEQETLIKVIDARSKATSVNIDAANLTPETFERFQQAQGEQDVQVHHRGHTFRRADRSWCSWQDQPGRSLVAGHRRHSCQGQCREG